MSRLRLLWAQISSSLWFIPTLLTVLAAMLAFGMVALDRASEIDYSVRFTFGAGAEGARGVLGTIAGSIITVTGVVFSITIVVLQLASSQFTPRVLRSFTGDRVVQVVLGVFIGTFTYSLLVLRTVRSPLEDMEAFVPSISVTVALALALLSIGFLIYFINHIAHSIQAEVILDRVTRDALHVVDELFPAELGDPAPPHASDSVDTSTWTGIRTGVSGYVQAVDDDSMTHLAEEHDAVIELRQRVGDFVLAGDEIARVSIPRGDDSLEKRIRSAITVGPQRTHYQDIARGIIELTDIAARALSPGINDPTTALGCVDRLLQIMARLAQRQFPERARVGESGKLRVIALRPSFADLVHLAYSPLRLYSAPHPIVATELARSLVRLIARVGPEHAAPLREQLHDLVAAARADWRNDHDLRRLEDAVPLASTRLA